MVTLAERVRWILKHRGFTQRGLSLASGLSQSHVGQLARGKLGVQVSGGTLEAIALAARVNLTWLQTGQGSPDVDPLPSPEDPAPNRTAAARLAREDGVYEAAVLRVLAEAVAPDTATRSVLWWAMRMKGAEIDLLASVADPHADTEREASPPPTQRRHKRTPSR